MHCILWWFSVWAGTSESLCLLELTCIAYLSFTVFTRFKVIKTLDDDMLTLHLAKWVTIYISERISCWFVGNWLFPWCLVSIFSWCITLDMAKNGMYFCYLYHIHSLSGCHWIKLMDVILRSFWWICCVWLLNTYISQYDDNCLECVQTHFVRHLKLIITSSYLLCSNYPSIIQSLS